MPTIAEMPIKAYAHCIDARCPGHEQEQVEAIRKEDSFTYAERGGNLGGTENSFVRVRFADESESTCRQCGRIRELSETPRRKYDGSLSGHDPMGLLDVEPFDPAKQPATDVVAERDQLREEVAELRGMMTAFMAQQQAPAPEPPATEE